MIKRNIEEFVFQTMTPGKVVLIFGARRVGKTVLLERLVERYGKRWLMLNGDDISTSEMLTPRTVSHYSQLFQNVDLLVIDEAQSIDDIGMKLKLIVDSLKGVAILVSGSSSFDLYNQTGEPLVGRSYNYNLFPFSVNELSRIESGAETFQKIDERLVYGMYPELIGINDFNKKKQYLLELVNSYLLKDILMVDGIKNSGKMRDLLRLIAYQIGSMVSYHELGKQLGLNQTTVEKYLDLLSKTFVIYKLPAYSKNSRKEISKSSKWYFADNGVRNAIIGDFTVASMRKDLGLLWENYMVSERIKKMSNQQKHTLHYF